MYDSHKVVEDVKNILYTCSNFSQEQCNKQLNCDKCRVKRLLNYVNNLDREESFYERRFNNVQ